MIIATFNGNPSTTIILCYSTTNVSEETDHITFYNELSSLVCSIPKQNVLIIGGEMNAQISKNVNNKLNLHNSSNRNREHQTDFTLENRLTCLNTKFQKRKGNYGSTSTQTMLKHRCCILTFDLAKNAIPRWCTGRKWHILMAVMRGNRVSGNWLMKWDEVKKFPWYTHRLMHRKRVTCELHDSYFRWMTINHTIPKIELAIESALNYYITQSR